MPIERDRELPADGVEAVVFDVGEDFLAHAAGAEVAGVAGREAVCAKAF